MPRARTDEEFPPTTATWQPDDWTSDGDSGTDAERRACRGSVRFRPDHAYRNYGLHRVLIDLNNQNRIIRECNFFLAQLLIKGPGQLTLRRCNLSKARWRLTDGATLVIDGGNAFQGQEN